MCIRDRDFILQIDPQFSVYRGMTGKGYTLQAVLKDASGKEIIKLQGEVEEILDLEHKACLLYTSRCV